MKKLFILFTLLFILTACTNEETITLEEYENLEEEKNELQEEVNNLEVELEEKENITYTDAGLEILEFDKPTDPDDVYYGEMSEEEFFYRIENTIEYLENEFKYYTDDYRGLVDNHLDTDKKDINSLDDYEILHKKSHLLYFELDEKCETLVTSDTLANGLGDSTFFNNVSSSCSSLANAFRYLEKYDSNAEMIENFFDSSQRSYEEALDYYEEEFE